MCALCGTAFDLADASSSCKGCVLATGCDLIRCPNCGYETPKEPRWLKKIFKKTDDHSTPSSNAITLSKLKRGQAAKITRLNTNDREILRKLMAMGVFPGLTIRMIQAYPSYVFQIGESQFAIDKKLADNIYVCLMR